MSSGKRGSVNTIHLPNTANVLLLYPGKSLKSQIDLWAFGCSERQVDVSFEQSLPAIRRLVRRANAVLVDATEDPSQATDAFLQATAQLGTASVAMYTETAHEGLEVFVRIQGSLFFLGPLLANNWDGFFEQLSEGKAGPPLQRFSRT